MEVVVKCLLCPWEFCNLLFSANNCLHSFTDKVMWEMIRSWILSTHFKIWPVWVISDFVNAFFTQYVLLISDHLCSMWLWSTWERISLVTCIKKKGRKNQTIVQCIKAWEVLYCHLYSWMYLSVILSNICYTNHISQKPIAKSNILV